MERLSNRVASVMEATLAAIDVDARYRVEWDASFVPKTYLSMTETGAAIQADPAIAFYVSATEVRSRQVATASSIAEASACTDPFVSSVTMNLWCRVQFNLTLMVADFEEVYEAVLGREP